MYKSKKKIKIYNNRLCCFKFQNCKTELGQLFATVEISVASHDTTGGMVTKITEAAMIAKLGIDVYIVEVIFKFV